MKYERFTMSGYKIPKDKEEVNPNFRLLYNRLAELEDKIENGTLIEEGYHIRKSYRNHDDQRYKITLVVEHEVDKIGFDGLTKAEAEKKLKELKGE